jgi:IS605 OrfB family transposase
MEDKAPVSFLRTLRLKVRSEGHAWLNAAAVEANQVFNYCNETSLKVATRADGKRKLLSGFDLCKLTAGASAYSDGERLDVGRWTQRFAEKLASAQRRGHKRQAKRIHRRAARCRAAALHEFSRKMVDRYQKIVVGDVSSLKLVRTRMAKSVLDSGWGMLRRFLEYKAHEAARSFEVVDERYTTVTCSNCGALSGPRGVNGLAVRFWVCSKCGALHDRDQNGARNTLIGSRCRTSVGANEHPYSLLPPSNAWRVREAGTEAVRTAA